jgi:uncharacterized protein YggU (UPF0235/DUF167 family)
VAGTVIRVKVNPNAQSASFVQLSDGSWLAKVRSPAIEGRANGELVALVADHFRSLRKHMAHAATDLSS